MEIKRVKYFFTLVQDRPGEVAQMANDITDAGVDLAALWGFGLGEGKAQIFFVPKDSINFKELMDKTGWQVKEGTCFRLTTEDKVGVLVELLDKIAKAGINLQAMDAIGVSGQVGCYLWCPEKEVEKLGQLLNA